MSYRFAFQFRYYHAEPFQNTIICAWEYRLDVGLASQGHYIEVKARVQHEGVNCGLNGVVCLEGGRVLRCKARHGRIKEIFKLGFAS